MNDHQPHPVPRIEIVETPTRRAVAATPSTARVPHPQPWHVRYIGGNGEPLATSEQLTSRDAAETNALALADLFGHPTATLEPSAFAESGGMFLDYGPTVPVVYVREGDAS